MLKPHSPLSADEKGLLIYNLSWPHAYLDFSIFSLLDVAFRRVQSALKRVTLLLTFLMATLAGLHVEAT